jgi:hypothetical protein
MRWNAMVKRPEWSRAAWCGLFAAVCVAAAVQAAPEDRPGLRVGIELDVTGELVVPVGRDGAPSREPVEMTARFDFEETAADTPPQTGSKDQVAGGVVAVASRSYRDATASMRVGGTTTNATLAADARRLLVARCGTTPIPYLTEAFLTGDEFDLLETPFDSLLLDELLAKEPVTIGQTWEIPADLTAGLLAIDTVDSGGLEARIEDVIDERAKVVISGIVDGAADGVPTHVTVEGQFTVAARSVAAVEAASDDEPVRHELHGRVTQVSAVIRERRQASHVAPGFEVEAKLLVTRTPIDAERPVADPTAEPAADSTPSSPVQGSPLRRSGAAAPGQVWYRDADGRLDLIHDTRWRRVEDDANGLVMRLVDRGALVGQCSISSLPRAPAAALPTRADLQRDIERSLAGQVDRTDAAEETDRDDGLRVVRLASSGTAGQLPFRWIHYVLAAQDGRRASVTFMFEESMQQRFADADRPLIESLRLPSDPSFPLQPRPTAALPAARGQQAR